MATSAKPYDDRPPVRVGPAPATSSGGADVLKEIWKTVKFVLAPVASLKLTVALFVASIFLVLVGTLAQDKQDMWEVIEDYFRPTLWPPKFGFAWIDAQVFFPEAWFPNMTETAASARSSSRPSVSRCSVGRSAHQFAQRSRNGNCWLSSSSALVGSGLGKPHRTLPSSSWCSPSQRLIVVGVSRWRSMRSSKAVRQAAAA